MEKQYLEQQKNKILAFGYEQYEKGEITERQLNDLYFDLYIKNAKMKV